jgi:hypothetical protein
MDQEAAFAIGVPIEIYAFDRYSDNSTSLFHPLAFQYPLPFPSWAEVLNNRLKTPSTHPLRPVIPNNACTPRITAAAGTKLAGAFFNGNVITYPYYW